MNNMYQNDMKIKCKKLQPSDEFPYSQIHKESIKCFYNELLKNDKKFIDNRCFIIKKIDTPILELSIKKILNLPKQKITDNLIYTGSYDLLVKYGFNTIHYFLLKKDGFITLNEYMANNQFIINSNKPIRKIPIQLENKLNPDKILLDLNQYQKVKELFNKI